MDPIALILPFFIGLSSMGCGCSLPIFPGLFMVLRGSGAQSRLRGLLLSLLFSLVILFSLIVFGFSLGYMQEITLQALPSASGEQALGALSILSLSTGSVVKVVGLALYVAIGLLFLLNLECRVTPNVSRYLPTQLSGFRGAFLGGVIYGIPASIACSIIFLLPFIFTSVASGDAFMTVSQFASFGVGRVTLIIILGMMFSSIHRRMHGFFLRGTRTLSRVIGGLLIVFGVYYFLYASVSGL